MGLRVHGGLGLECLPSAHEAPFPSSDQQVGDHRLFSWKALLDSEFSGLFGEVLFGAFCAGCEVFQVKGL